MWLNPSWKSQLARNQTACLVVGVDSTFIIVFVSLSFHGSCSVVLMLMTLVRLWCSSTLVLLFGDGKVFSLSCGVSRFHASVCVRVRMRLCCTPSTHHPPLASAGHNRAASNTHTFNMVRTSRTHMHMDLDMYSCAEWKVFLKMFRPCGGALVLVVPRPCVRVHFFFFCACGMVSMKFAAVACLFSPVQS